LLIVIGKEEAADVENKGIDDIEAAAVDRGAGLM
jgi:hypothetical protein